LAGKGPLSAALIRKNLDTRREQTGFADRPSGRDEKPMARRINAPQARPRCFIQHIFQEYE
jgi:hypothetical protein